MTVAISAIHLACPLVAQKNDQVGFETSLLRTTRSLGGVGQSIDPVLTDPQADARVLAPVLCEQLAWVNLGLFRFVLGVG